MDPKQQLIDALNTYRAAHAIDGDDLIRVAAPGDELWDAWFDVSGMAGDPETAVIAIRVEGFGSFYPTVAEAIEEVERYYHAED